MRAERYVVTGRILTMTDPQDVADWMLVERGAVAGAGRGDPPPEIAERLGFLPDTEIEYEIVGDPLP